jgi:NAD(P)-dependent dehydrogenase (short-subunit alcohol dehydrogenase family)
MQRLRQVGVLADRSSFRLRGGSIDVSGRQSILIGSFAAKDTRMSSLFDLTGKVAVVTGSSRGIGRAIAERMAEHGAKVVISSRKADVCEAVAAGIRAKGGEATVVPCHIARKEELQKLVDQTTALWGGIDIMVSNAAVNPYLGPAAGASDEVYERIMGANVRSNFWLANMACPRMAERGGGSFIVISSIGGFRGTASLGLYGISKAADMQLTRNIAVEWGPKNVRANCIAPGLVRTDFARALWEDPVRYRKTTRDNPLQRIGEPDEIAGAAVFLASPAGSFVTGHTLVVDGGTMAGVVLQKDE